MAGTLDTMQCQVPDCLAEAVGRGWCNRHWKRWRRYGDPLAGKWEVADRGLSPEGRFWTKVQQGDGCWEWQASRRLGYGRFWLNGRFVAAHRFAWEQENGSVPEGLEVCHRCDNPPCVRPDHLFLGTTQENINDMVAKGRHRGPIGERAPKAKLTADKVREIRNRYPAEPIRALAREYSVSPHSIRCIVQGRTWRHVS